VQRFGGKDFANGEFDNLRVLIESLPLPGAESGLTASRLTKPNATSPAMKWGRPLRNATAARFPEHVLT
jgi:hypothetical protein